MVTWIWTTVHQWQKPTENIVRFNLELVTLRYPLFQRLSSISRSQKNGNFHYLVEIILFHSFAWNIYLYIYYYLFIFQLVLSHYIVYYMIMFSDDKESWIVFPWLIIISLRCSHFLEFWDSLWAAWNTFYTIHKKLFILCWYPFTGCHAVKWCDIE